MNEKLQEQLGKILELMLAGLEKASEVAETELPGLIEDYLSMYYIDAIPVVSTVGAVLSIILVMLLYKVIHPVVKNDKDFAPVYISMLVPLIIFLVCLSEIAFSVKEMIKIEKAPKAYLIEKLRK